MRENKSYFDNYVERFKPHKKNAYKSKGLYMGDDDNLHDGSQSGGVDRLVEMATAGTFKGYDIIVYGNEGQYVPHFHFRNIQTGENGCIKILENAYFSHGTHNAELNSGEQKALMAFMKSPASKKYGGTLSKDATNYDVVKMLWDMSNNGNISDIKNEIPDYSNIT